MLTCPSTRSVCRDEWVGDEPCGDPEDMQGARGGELRSVRTEAHR